MDISQPGPEYKRRTIAGRYEVGYCVALTFANYASAGPAELQNLVGVLDDLASLAPDDAYAVMCRFREIVNDPREWSEWRREWRDILGFPAEGMAEVFRYLSNPTPYSDINPRPGTRFKP